MRRRMKDEDLEQIPTQIEKKSMSKSLDKDPISLITTGIIQGFTGSGHFMGIIPAITLPSIISASLYLLAFCVGTIVAVTAFTAFVGEASFYMVKSGRNTANQLAFLASTVSLVFGSVYLLWSITNLMQTL